MATVRQWTGHEARILRLARRMSVRRYAEHLGVNPAAISNWEKRGKDARLRFETQEMLDTDLAQAPDDVRDRFHQGLADGLGTGRGGPELLSGVDGRVHSTPVQSGLGRQSASRTAAILKALRSTEPSRLRYLPPIDAAREMSEFLASPSRVFLVKGPPGCGKTSLAYHVAECANAADFQLLTADHWLDRDVDLATEVLRYGSTSAQSDALLTLEKESAALARPLIVIIDSPRTRDAADQLCLDLDKILRQVITTQLRFIMVLRTPPDVELTRFPVLAAAVMPSAGRTLTSLELGRWDLATARKAWNDSRSSDEPPFDALPTRIRNLARLALYMHLIKIAGSTQPRGLTSAYRLVQFCVKSIIGAAGHDVTETAASLTRLSQRELLWVLPQPILEALSTVPDVAVPRESIADSGVPSMPPPLFSRTSVEDVTFEHDIIREYFFATWLARVIEERGRSAATVEVFNSLAERTSTSANLRGILEFLLQCLDANAPELLAAVAQSPTISITTALPLMLDLVGDNAGFAGAEVLRVCASRCLHDNGLPLAKALLRYAAVAPALGAEHPRWMLRVLRHFGSDVWPEMVSCVEGRLPVTLVHEFVGLANLEAVEDAVFFARHFFVFFGDDEDSAKRLERLLNHSDWRVRAAIADGMRCGNVTNNNLIARLVKPLTRDRDYKVRAAVAAAIGRLAPAVAQGHVATLLNDASWHVRERLLLGITTGGNSVDDVVKMALEDESWRESPVSVRVAVQRLLLTSGNSALPDAESHRRALFSLLREIRSGALRVPSDVRQRLIADGLTSSWLVRQEAIAMSDSSCQQVTDVRVRKEAFRRLRDRRSIQVALDVRDLQQAVAVARAAAVSGAQFVEVGDPLIKGVGVGAIEEVKRNVPGVSVVAEMMSADWGRDQVVLAAEAGADVVLLIGPASLASVSAAVEASRKLALPLVIDVPRDRLTQDWVQDMERAGVDGFAVTTNIDLGVAAFHPLDQAQLLRSWTKLPIAVSGGFEPMDAEAKQRHSWDIMIIGRGVTDAVDPQTAAQDLAAFISPNGQGLPH